MTEIALVAGEPSGDVLGAGLIEALKYHYPNAKFYGIGGDNMLAQGFRSWFPIEKLSVMGFAEVIAHIPEILRIRRVLYRRLSENPPDLFIGIDAPEFNLGLERKLRQKGIVTAQYVCPQVWAWRQWRVRKITRSADILLTLFPFEAEFFRQYRMPAQFVGHPLADDIPLHNDSLTDRRALNLPLDGPLLALLPGSRLFEVQALAPVFIATAQSLLAKRSDLKVVIAAANQDIRSRLIELANRLAPQLPMAIVHGQTKRVLSASDVVLLASGTATLETLLLKKPMVVAYIVSSFSAWLARRLVNSQFFSLPNLLANQPLVDEFFQEQVTSENLTKAVLSLVDDRAKRQHLAVAFSAIHQVLRQDANRQAATALVDLLAGMRKQDVTL